MQVIKIFSPLLFVSQNFVSYFYLGTGLGLFITQYLVKSMGGEINLVSSKGKGATFTFWLEMRKRRRRNSYPFNINISSDLILGQKRFSRRIPSPNRIHIPQNPHEGEIVSNILLTHLLDGDTVLIVEDNAVNRKLLETMISGFGCSFISAKNGKEAVDIFKKNKSTVSLIFMDVHMPVLDGISATKKIKSIQKKEKLDAIPIIGATADCETSAMREMKEAGMSYLIFKPYNLESIRTALAQNLRRGKRDLKKRN